MKLKYCEVCGKKLIRKEAKTFDTKTGKKRILVICKAGHFNKEYSENDEMLG